VKLWRRGIDLRGGKDINILRSHSVSEVMDQKFDAIPASMNLADIFHRIEQSKETYFVVNDNEGNLRGVISFQDIRNLLSQHELDYLVIAQDLVGPDAVVVEVSDDLEKAQQIFGHRDSSLIPVVSKMQPNKVIGVIRKDELTDYYNKRLIETLRG
jgi:CIC family chloride channel protein